jgi:ribosomal protein L33
MRHFLRKICHFVSKREKQTLKIWIWRSPPQYFPTRFRRQKGSSFEHNYITMRTQNQAPKRLAVQKVEKYHKF